MANGTKQVVKHVTIPIPFCRQKLAFPLRPTPRSVGSPSARNCAGAGWLWPHTPWTQHGVKSNLLRGDSFSSSSLLSAWINGCFAPPRSNLKIDRESRAEFQLVFGLSVGEFPGLISSNGSRQRLCKLWRWSAHRTSNLKSLMNIATYPVHNPLNSCGSNDLDDTVLTIIHTHSISYATPLKSNLNFSSHFKLKPEYSLLQKSYSWDLWNYFSNTDIHISVNSGKINRKI